MMELTSKMTRTKAIVAGNIKKQMFWYRRQFGPEFHPAIEFVRRAIRLESGDDRQMG